MLKLNTKSSIIPNVPSTIEILKDNQSKLGVIFDYDRMLEYYTYFNSCATKRIDLINRQLKLESNWADVTVNSVKRAIKKYGYDKYFDHTKTDISLNMESVEHASKTGMIPEDFLRLIKFWSEAVSYKATVSWMDKIFKKYSVHPTLYSVDGHRILIVHTGFAGQNTGRIGTVEPATMNISRKIKDCITTIPGWNIVYADSGQVDPRILYSFKIKDPQIKELIMLYNDAYYGLLHYSSMPIEHIRDGRLTFTKNEITDDLKAQRNNLKTLGNAVVYGLTADSNGDAVISNYIERIGNNRYRLKLVDDLQKQFMNEDYIVYTAFNTPIDVRNEDAAKSKLYESKSSESYMSRLIRCAINAYAQGTAADCMRLGIREADKIINRYAQDSYIMLSIHDALIFNVADKDMDYAEQLASCSSYQIDDWIPIYSDMVLGMDCKNPALNPMSI